MGLEPITTGVDFTGDYSIIDEETTTSTGYRKNTRTVSTTHNLSESQFIVADIISEQSGGSGGIYAYETYYSWSFDGFDKVNHILGSCTARIGYAFPDNPPEDRTLTVTASINFPYGDIDLQKLQLQTQVLEF